MSSLIRSTLDSVLAAELPQHVLLDAAASGQEPSAYHAKVVEFGLPGILVSEDQGGVALDEVGLADIFEVAGRRLLPLSMLEESVVVAPTLARVATRGDGQADDWLAALLAGSVRGGSATTPSSPVPPVGASQPVRIVEVASAPARLPPEASLACLMGRSWLVLLDLGDAHVTHDRTASLDPGVRRLRVSGAAIDEHRVLTDDDARSIIVRWHVALFAYIAGCVNHLTDVTVGHTQERHQFGRPIAEFQSVAHTLADMVVARESISSCVARLVVLCAEDPIGEADTVDWLIACLRYWIPKQARDVCERAIHLHGGMGYSWELGLHLYYRRVLQVQATFGGAYASAREVGQVFLEGSPA
jgi:alkylation response protein AidB-like acyl-CoA dehydrogenase